MDTTFKTPGGWDLNLPSRWTAQRLRADGPVVLLTLRNEAHEILGYVSVNEATRGYVLGQTDRVPTTAATRYKGRGWQALLFQDAMAALHAVWA